MFWGGGRLWEVVARGGSTVRSKGTDGFKTFLLPRSLDSKVFHI